LQGDVYNLLDTGDNYVYVIDLNNTGEAGWDKLSGMIDLSTINLQTVLNNGSRAVDQSTNSSIFLDATSKIVSYNFTDLISLQSSFYQDLSSHVVQLFNDNAYSIESIINSSNGLISMNVTDSNSRESKGFRFNNTSALHYNDDYSDIFNDRSLVDKGYVSQNCFPINGNNSEPMNGFLFFGDGYGIKRVHYENGTGFENAVRFIDNQVTISASDLGDGSQTYLNVTSQGVSIEAYMTGSRGLTSVQDFTPNIEELDFVQKKYVDTIVSQNSISDEVILTHQMAGTASYKKIGDFAYLNLNLFGRADANGKSLADANQSGFGNLNKIIPVMASDDTVKFIRLRGVDHSPGLTITKANLSDDDFDFTINDVLLVSFAGFVPL